MTKISNKEAYPLKTLPVLTDFVIGTNDETSNKKTQNFQLEEIRELFIEGLTPEIGGTIKITEITPTTEETDPVVVANALAPDYEVAQYELLFLNLNGVIHLLKLVNRSIGATSTALPAGSFISFSNYTPRNVGGAMGLYKSKTGLFFDFKTLESLSLLIAQNEAQEKVSIELDIVSDSFIVTKPTVGTFKIEPPASTDIVRFIVNSAYTGTEETGSLSKPFKTIQGAKTAYIGTGNAQAPQFINAEIIIQKGVGYTYTGDFSFNTGTGSIILEEGTLVTSAPTGDWLSDFDTLSDTSTALLNIILKENARLELQKSGFRNRGTTVDNSAFTDVKQVNITGTGRISQNSTSLTNTYTIFESNYTANDTYNNDGASPYNVRGVAIATNTQSIHKIGGNSRIDYTDCQTITINAITGLSTSTVFFNQIGGIVNISNTALSISPFFAITLDKIFPVSKSVGIPCTLQITNTSINGRMTTFVSNETSEQSSVNISNITSQRNLLTCVNVAKSASVLWTNFISLNCVFALGEVDQAQVDLTAGNTISTTNIFGLKLVESLQVFASRALAVSSGGLKKGNAFINRKTVNAGSFVIGREYQILTVGDTDFTAIGASANTVGINFTATGVGSGTGTAYFYTRDILI